MSPRAFVELLTLRTAEVYTGTPLPEALSLRHTQEQAPAPVVRRESGRGQPHSKTWRRQDVRRTPRSVLACGCPLPLCPSSGRYKLFLAGRINGEAGRLKPGFHTRRAHPGKPLRYANGAVLAVLSG